MNLRCVTGSSAVPKKPEEFKFKLFNHSYDINKGSAGAVNSGLDAYGPGVYAYGQSIDEEFDVENVNSARIHSGKDGNGSVLGFTVDMTDHDGEVVELANEVEVGRIPEHEWANVIQSMVDKIRDYCNYNAENAENNLKFSLGSWKRNGTPPTQLELENIKKEMGTWGEKVNLALNLDSGVDEWGKRVREEIKAADPSDFIVNVEDYGIEFDPMVMVDIKLESAENLWEAMVDVWHYCAIEKRGRKEISYNNLFQEAIKENISNPSLLKAALVNDGLFYVVFDTESINLEYAETYSYDIDEDLFQSTLDKIIEVNQTYFYELEPHQIKMKMDEVTKESFGVAMSDDVFNLMSGVRSRESMYSKLYGALKNEFCSLEVGEWSAAPDSLNRFKPQDLKEEIENTVSPKI